MYTLKRLSAGETINADELTYTARKTTWVIINDEGKPLVYQDSKSAYIEWYERKQAAQNHVDYLNTQVAA